MADKIRESRCDALGDVLQNFDERLAAGEALSSASLDGLDARDLTRVVEMQECLLRLERLRIDDLWSIDDTSGIDGAANFDHAESFGSTAQPPRGSTFPSLPAVPGNPAVGDDESASAINASCVADRPATEKDAASTEDGSAPMGAPKRIGRFEIIRVLGRGGQGLMLMAYDPVLARRLALKVPWSETLMTPKLRRRFLREAQAVARLTHPHIVAVYEVGEVGPICFIASALVEGESLAARIKRCAMPFDSREVASLVADLADAMQYAHDQGVVHRDLKPGNVLLEPLRTDAPARNGEMARHVPKITDFGLAKVLDMSGEETRTGALLGTPAYMSPEQANGHHSAVGPAADIYALGTMLYELLTGQLPFRGRSDAETLRLVASEPPVPPRQRNGKCPSDLQAICLKCLEKSPRGRYTSAGELAEDLRRFLAGAPTRARPLFVAQRAVRWCQQNRALATAMAAAAGLIVSVAIISAISAVRINTARRDAVASAALAEKNARDERVVRAEAERLRDELRQNVQTLKHRERELQQQLYPMRFQAAYGAILENDARPAQRLVEQSSREDGSPPTFEMSYLRESARTVPRQLATGAGDILTLKYTPDGRHLVAGTDQGMLCVWDAQTLEPVQRKSAHEVCICDLALSPAAQLAATVSCDKLVRLWDIETWQCVGELPGHTIAGAACALSPDGTLLATGSGRPTDSPAQSAEIILWDVTQRRRIASWQAAPRDIKVLGFAEDGHSLVAAFETGEILQWDLTVSPPVARNISAALAPPPRISTLESRALNSIAFSPDCRLVTYVTQDLEQMRVILAAPAQGSSRELFRINASSPVGAFSPDGRILAQVDDRGRVHLHLTGTGGTLGVLPKAPGRVRALTFSPDGTTLAVGGSMDFLALYDLSFPLEVHHQLPALSECLGVDINCRRIYLGNKTGGVDVRNVGTGEIERQIHFPGHSAINVICISPDERWACIQNRDDPGYRPIHIVSLTDDAHAICLRAPVTSATFSHDSRLVAALTHRGVSMTELATGRQLWEAPIARPHFDTCCGQLLDFTTDNRQLAISVRTGEHCLLFDVENASRRDYGPSSTGIRMCADGRHALRIRGGLGLEVMDAQTGTTKILADEPNGDIVDAHFSPDGETIASVSVDGTVRLWHVASGQQLCVMAKLPYQLRYCEFSRDGSTIVTWRERPAEGLLDFHAFRVPGP